jgi:hypothetical protein
MSEPQSPLTQARLHELLAYDEATGCFTWRVSKSRSIQVGASAGSIGDKGYRRIAIDGRNYRAARLAWLYVYGTWPQHHIDHMNRQRDDDRVCNLRDVSVITNLMNRDAPKNSHGHTGVSFHDGLYVSHIGHDGEYHYLGCFPTAAEAGAAYQRAARELRGDAP